MLGTQRVKEECVHMLHMLLSCITHRQWPTKAILDSRLFNAVALYGRCVLRTAAIEERPSPHERPRCGKAASSIWLPRRLGTTQVNEKPLEVLPLTTTELQTSWWALHRPRLGAMIRQLPQAG